MSENLQTFCEYVENLGDRRKYWEWDAAIKRNELKHPHWRWRQAQAAAFREVFPGLALPPQFEPKP